MPTVSIDVVDEILGAYVNELGTNFVGYRNHVLRMLRFTFAHGDFDEIERGKVLIAAAFHDLGIWTHNTFDYIGPSVELAQKYLIEHNLADWEPAVTEMIAQHHSLRSCNNPIVEAFRNGDLTDFSLGLIKFGLPASQVRKVKAELPNSGFHRQLVRVAARWFLRHPLNPLPVVKF